MTKFDKLYKLDRVANGFKRRIPIPFYDYIQYYLYIMRKIECCNNGNFLKLFYKFIFRQLSVKLGISITPGCFQEGLSLYHYGSIVVNENVKGGRFVTIQSDVNISSNVIIGDDVYIAPGAKILQNVRIADGVIIGANSVVTKSIDEPDTTWVGIPAKKIKNTGYLRRSLDL